MKVRVARSWRVGGGEGEGRGQQVGVDGVELGKEQMTQYM